MADPLLNLCDAIAAHLTQASTPPSRMRSAVTQLLESARTARPQMFTARTSRYAALVERSVKNAEHTKTGHLAANLLPVHLILPWVYHYTPRSPDEDLSDRIAFAELIGPDGPLLAPNSRVGFTVMAEHTSYPLHVHPAVELYLVIAGVAKWQTPTSERHVLPGEFVFHRSDEPHAMHTADEPLLALWSWSGDIDAPAAYV